MKVAIIFSAVFGVATSVANMAPAMAQTTSGSFTVGATTTKFCTNPTTTNVALGEYNGTIAKSGTTTIQFKCTRTTPSTIRLKPSGSAVASSNGTLKTSPPNGTPIAYTLTPNNTFTANGSGLGSLAGFSSITPTVNVAANQNPFPGNYSDTIIVEVSY